MSQQATSRIDGVTVKATGSGEAFTATCDSAGMVTLEAADRDAAICKTLGELDEAIRDGEFYVPDPDEWRTVRDAVEGQP